jgi:hypothetical protein
MQQVRKVIIFFTNRKLYNPMSEKIYFIIIILLLVIYYGSFCV